MERVEIAVIGTGPAGISAAITAKARNRKVLLLGKRDLSSKLRVAHQINNYPGLPSVGGEEFAEAFSRHLEAMEIAVEECQVTAVYAMGDYFAIDTNRGMYEAQSVILAAGVSQSQKLPGEEEFLGRGVSYCATCDAMFFRGKTVAVVGYNGESAAEAEFLAKIAAKVLYFPQKGAGMPDAAKVEVIKEKPKGITGQQQVEALETEQGRYPVDGVFILRDSVAPDRLVPGLSVEGNHVAVSRQMETNLPGCFACGDVVGKPYQYVKAAGEGNVAALSAAAYLAAAEKKEA